MPLPPGPNARARRTLPSGSARSEKTRDEWLARQTTQIQPVNGKATSIKLRRLGHRLRARGLWGRRPLFRMGRFC
jgi:hypothetical protein